MLILDKTFEVHCCKDPDDPTKDKAWYVIASFSTRYNLDTYWMQMGCTKKAGYRKVEITREMKIIK